MFVLFLQVPKRDSSKSAGGRSAAGSATSRYPVPGDFRRRWRGSRGPNVTEATGPLQKADREGAAVVARATVGAGVAVGPTHRAGAAFVIFVYRFWLNLLRGRSQAARRPRTVPGSVYVLFGLSVNPRYALPLRSDTVTCSSTTFSLPALSTDTSVYIS